MGKEPIEEKELSLSARHGASDTGQIVQLPESAGKGCFTALVRTGYYKYALFVFEVKVIADDR
jgi:hypothetical protein